MATVTFFTPPNPVLQNTVTARWTWSLGDRDSYWGFSVRPFQANNTAEVTRVISSSDNNLNQVTILDVTVRGIGSPDVGLLRFTAIKVQP
jgi:hypothetical protein